MSDLPTKALSIRQPWAWAIVNAGKDIENRTRRFNYRGPICIHASATVKVIEYIEDWARIYRRFDVRPPNVDDVRNGSFTGGIIATAEITDCVETSTSPWFQGPYGLVLANVQPVDFIPLKGALGLFDWRTRL
jgi:hypothetical protein